MDVLISPTADIDHTSHKLFQEAISLDFEEIIENRVTMETSNNTQPTTSTANKSNTCTMTEIHSTLGLSPNQPNIHYSVGSTTNVPHNSHVRVCPPKHMSDSIAGHGIEPEGDCWNEDTDDFDSLMDEEALMKVDILCQETHELKEEEIEITKKATTISEEDDEVLVISDDEELIEQDSGVKTLQDIAEEEEKDVYDPAVLGKMLIHCHLFFYSASLHSFPHLFTFLIYPSILLCIHPFFHLSFLLFIHLFIHVSFYPFIYPSIFSSIHPFILPSINPYIHSFFLYSSIYPFIHLLYSFHSSIKPSSLIIRVSSTHSRTH